MNTITWQKSFDTGIGEIDIQHRQLLDYLNELGTAISLRDKKKTASVVDGLSDYAMSHFAFEEALMEEAEYKFSGPHKHVHKMLIGKVVEFDSKLKAGEEIAEELYTFLRRWLVNHIQRDDAAYVKTVREHFDSKEKEVQQGQETAGSGWMTRLARKIFG